MEHGWYMVRDHLRQPCHAGFSYSNLRKIHHFMTLTHPWVHLPRYKEIGILVYMPAITFGYLYLYVAIFQVLQNNIMQERHNTLRGTYLPFACYTSVINPQLLYPQGGISNTMYMTC